MLDNSSDELNDLITVRTVAALTDLSESPSSLTDPESEPNVDLANYPTSSLTPAHILWLHRLVLGESSLTKTGFRTEAVWLSERSANVTVFTPATPSEVEPKLAKLLEHWRGNYLSLIEANDQQISQSLGVFHYEFLAIHPFLDGNGRIARVLLQQQIHELLHKDLRAVFSNVANEYYRCLAKANSGDVQPLVGLILRLCR